MTEETVTLGNFYATELRILPGGHVQLWGRLVAPGPLQPWSIAAGRPAVIHVGRVEGGHAWGDVVLPLELPRELPPLQPTRRQRCTCTRERPIVGPVTCDRCGSAIVQVVVHGGAVTICPVCDDPELAAGVPHAPGCPHVRLLAEPPTTPEPAPERKQNRAAARSTKGGSRRS